MEDLGTQLKELWGVRARRNDLRTAALSLEQSPDEEQALAQQTGKEQILAQQSQAEQLLMSQAPKEQEPADADKLDFDFRANYDGKTLSMSGIVDTIAATDMLDSAPDMLPPGLVFDNTVESGAEVLIFSPDKLKTGIATLTQLKNGELRIDDAFFRLKGIADNPSRIDQIRKQIRASKETLKPLEVVLDLEVDPNNTLSAKCKAKFGLAIGWVSRSAKATRQLAERETAAKGNSILDLQRQLSDREIMPELTASDRMLSAQTQSPFFTRPKHTQATESGRMTPS